MERLMEEQSFKLAAKIRLDRAAPFMGNVAPRPRRFIRPRLPLAILRAKEVGGHHPRRFIFGISRTLRTV